MWRLVAELVAKQRLPHERVKELLRGLKPLTELSAGIAALLTA
jgi:hypothetical protein